MNSLLQVLHLLGALGLFIYGMVLMSESIQRLTGRRLRSAVSAVTRNPTRAYLSGLSLTGILQSSSVTTLMARTANPIFSIMPLAVSNASLTRIIVTFGKARAKARVRSASFSGFMVTVVR